MILAPLRMAPGPRRGIPADWCELRPVRAEPITSRQAAGHDACAPLRPVSIPFELNTDLDTPWTFRPIQARRLPVPGSLAVASQRRSHARVNIRWPARLEQRGDGGLDQVGAGFGVGAAQRSDEVVGGGDPHGIDPEALGDRGVADRRV